MAQSREPERVGWSIPALYRVRGRLDLPRLEQAVAAIVARHQPLRTRIGLDGRTATLEAPYPVRAQKCAGSWREALSQPFNLEREPPLRVQVFEPDLLLFTFHHVAADGWSLTVFGEELSSLYAGRPTPPLTASYSDYAEWQQCYLASEQARAHEAFWAARLGRRMPGLQLPAGSGPPRPNCIQPLTLGAEDVHRLRSRAQKAGCSLFTLCLAVFQQCLGAMSGHRRIPLCTTVAGRNQARWEPLIGMFTNLVPIFANLETASDLASLLRQQQQEQMRALERQEYPFVLMQRRLAAPPPGQLSCFEVGFTWLKGHRFQKQAGLDAHIQLDLGDCVLETQPSANEQGDFSLLLSLVESGPVLGGHLEWRPHRVDSGFAEELARRVTEGLRAGGAPRPATRLTVSEPGSLAPVSPDLALLSDEEKVSYEQLDRAANQLARQLGPVQGEIVALSMRRSPRAVLGMLAIAKAGGIFLPLDPATPEGRLRLILEDARPVVAVGEPLAGLPTLSMPRDWTGPDCGPEAAAQEVLYRLYTSGSTGTPKAVDGTRAGLLNRLRFQPWEADEVGCHKTSLAFVDFVAELFGPLQAGRPVAVFEQGDLVEFVRRHGVTRLTLVPGLLRSLLPELARNPGRLRRIVCSGEPLPGRLVLEFRERLPGVQLWNLYGSTEVAGDVTAFDTSMYRGRGPVPVGTPLPGVSVECRNGEVWVTGPCLARGLPLRQGWYGMGDLGRWNDERQLEVLGRSDGTRKLSGQRVHPAELEAVLAETEGVKEVAVVTEPLRAYYSGCGPVEESLRRHFPSAAWPELIELEALPRTPTGKVDRLELQARASGPAPDPDLIREILSLWPLQADGPNVHFFESGGDSLLALELLARLEERFGFRLGLHRLLQAPTPAQQALLVREQASEGKLVPLGPLLGTGKPVWFAPPLGGELFVYRHLTGLLAPEFRTFGLRVGNGSVAEEAAGLAHELSSWPGPHRLAGLSLGGWYVVEVARLLREMGHDVAPVVLIESWAPRCRFHRRSRPEWLLRWFALQLYWLLKSPSRGRDLLLKLRRTPGSLPKMVRWLLRRPSSRSQPPPGLPQYEMKPFPGEVVLLRAWLQASADPLLGWGEICPRLQVQDVMGAHGTNLVEPPACAQVVRELRRVWC